MNPQPTYKITPARWQGIFAVISARWHNSKAAGSQMVSADLYGYLGRFEEPIVVAAMEQLSAAGRPTLPTQPEWRTVVNEILLQKRRHEVDTLLTATPPNDTRQQKIQLDEQGRQEYIRDHERELRQFQRTHPDLMTMQELNTRIIAMHTDGPMSTAQTEAIKSGKR